MRVSYMESACLHRGLGLAWWRSERMSTSLTHGVQHSSLAAAGMSVPLTCCFSLLDPQIHAQEQIPGSHCVLSPSHISQPSITNSPTDMLASYLFLYLFLSWFLEQRRKRVDYKQHTTGISKGTTSKLLPCGLIQNQAETGENDLQLQGQSLFWVRLWRPHPTS